MNGFHRQTSLNMLVPPRLGSRCLPSDRYIYNIYIILKTDSLQNCMANGAKCLNYSNDVGHGTLEWHSKVGLLNIESPRQTTSTLPWFYLSLPVLFQQSLTDSWKQASRAESSISQHMATLSATCQAESTPIKLRHAAPAGVSQDPDALKRPRASL